MAKVIASVPFNGTAEQKQQLLDFIAEHKAQKGALMPIMQKAQEIYGYLPIEVQKMISDETGIPLEKIYGVATFFDRISEILGIGEGGCTPDGKFSLDSCRCVGACGLAPVMMINDDVYGRLVPADVDGILKKY